MRVTVSYKGGANVILASVNTNLKATSAGLACDLSTSDVINCKNLDFPAA